MAAKLLKWIQSYLLSTAIWVSEAPDLEANARKIADQTTTQKIIVEQQFDDNKFAETNASNPIQSITYNFPP